MTTAAPLASDAPSVIALWGKRLAELPTSCAAALSSEPIELVEEGANADVVVVWLERSLGPADLGALCEARRAESPAAYLMCYAPTASQSFCEPALVAGFDDVMAGRHSIRELISRVMALGRRRRSRRPDGTLRFGSLRLEMATCRLWVEGEAIALTRTEARLLAELIRALGDLRSREALLLSAWGEDSLDASERAVDNALSRLRRKLPPQFSIATVRGTGFRLELE